MQPPGVQLYVQNVVVTFIGLADSWNITEPQFKLGEYQAHEFH